MTTPTHFSATCQAFVPSTYSQPVQSFTSAMQEADQAKAYPSSVFSTFDPAAKEFAMTPNDTFGSMYKQASMAQDSPKLQYSVSGQYNCATPMAQGSYAQPKLMHATSAKYGQPRHVYGRQQSALTTCVTPTGQPMAGMNSSSMPQYKMNFNSIQQRRCFPTQQAKHQQYASARNLYASSSQSLTEGVPSALPLNKLHQHQDFACMDSAVSPMTKSTTLSSSGVQSEMDDCDLESVGFESPMAASQVQGQSPMSRASSGGAKLLKENGWKKKVKTELCRFWLNGQACENSQKDQGCGFAHGQDELQKKKGLSRQYLTSVCKNFLDHPSKCSYGQRCIFQHPTHDVRKRQAYKAMIQDNARYTAMRLFQEIEGSEVIYINTYAASTPRLAAFRGICSSAKDNGEDYVDGPEDMEPATTDQTNFSRDLFRSNSAPTQ